MAKKKIEIFKLEERVLFDAAAVADIVDQSNAVANLNSQVSESQAQANEERDALKNAPPENPADSVVSAAGHDVVTPDTVADLDAAATALVEGEIASHTAAHDAAASGDAPDDGGTTGGDGEPVSYDVGDSSIDDFIQFDGDADHDGDIDHNSDSVDAGADVDQVDDGIDDVDDDGDHEPVAVSPETFAADAPEAGRELVIINSSVKDAQKIVDALGDNTDVLYLEKGTDALDSINEFLDQQGDVKYSAIHVVSHGNAGYFILNGEIIDAESVTNDPASWAAIGEHLTDDGDIMLYGCNIAGNMDGQMLVSQIAQFTGADVAASADNTGVHGNWDLEYSIGAIDNGFIQVQDYNYSLESIAISVGADDSLSAQMADGSLDGYDEVAITITVDELVDNGSITFKDGVNYSFIFDSTERYDSEGNPTGVFDPITDINKDGYHFSFNGDVTFESGTTVDFSNFDHGLTNTVSYVFTDTVAFAGNDVVSVSTKFATMDASRAATSLGNANSTLGLNLTGTNGGRFTFDDLEVGRYQTLTVGGANLVLGGNNVNNGTVGITDATLQLGAGASLSNSGNFTSGAITSTGTITNSGNLTAGSIQATKVTNVQDSLLSLTSGSSSITTLDNSGVIALHNGTTLTIGASDGDISDVCLTHNGMINGNGGTVKILQSTEGTGRVNMTGGAFYYTNTQPDAFFSGTYNDIGYVLEYREYYWSDLQLPSNVIVNGSVMIGSNGPITVNFDFADTAFSGIRFFDSTFTVASTDSTGVFYEEFLAAQGNTLSNIAVGNIQIGADGESINHDVTLANFKLAGSYIDATRIAANNNLYLNDFDNNDILVPQNFELQVAEDDAGVAAISVGYRGDSQLIWTLTDGNGNELSYLDLTINGSASMAGNISVYRTLTLGENTAVTIDRVYSLTLGSANRNISNIYDQLTSSISVSDNGVFTMYIGDGQEVNSSISASSGSVNIYSSGNSVFQNSIILTGSAQMTLNGADTTFNGVVGIGEADTAKITITGDNFRFNKDVTTAYGWYVENHYYYDDASYQSNIVQTATTIDRYKGTIVIDLVDSGSDGTNISFNGQVVTLNEFSIVNAGSVTFSQLVAVAGGVFNIGTGAANSSVGSVQFSGNVYVSAAFNGVDTTFNVRADRTNFDGDLWNWVRTYRYLWSYNPQIYGQDFTYDGENYILNVRKDVAASVNMERGTISFNSASTVYNIGVFGEANFSISSDARVTMTNVHNIGLNNYESTSGDHPAQYPRQYLQYQQYFFPGEYTTDGYDYPLNWDVTSYHNTSWSRGASFTINGDSNVVAGDVLNLGTVAKFVVNGTSNAFRGDFINATGANVNITGSQNYFVNLSNLQTYIVSANASTVFSEVNVTGMHYFDQVTNNEVMEITNPGSSRLYLISGSTRATTAITGDADGFSFTGLEINAGQVTIDALFDSNYETDGFTYGINSDITLGSDGILVVNKANEFRGTINNGGQVSLNADGIVINGTVNNLEGGTFNLKKDVTINGAVNNSGAFLIGAADMIFGAQNTFTNLSTGTITIGYTSIFNSLVNQGKVEFGDYAAGTIFWNLNNSGTININAKRVIFDKGLTNSGTLSVTSGAEGVRFLNMLDSTTGDILFVNSGVLNLDGDLTDQISVRNVAGGQITVGQNATLDFAKVINAGTITAGLRSNVNFYGEVHHSGVFNGEGNLFFYNVATGTGTFAMSGSSTVTYNFNGNGGSTTVYLNNDNYWCIGGVVVSDAYSNRPVWSEVYGWVFSDNPTVQIAPDQSQYAVVSLDNNGNWVVGTVNTGVAAAYATDAQPVLDAATNTWMVNGVSTGIVNAVSQSIFGGSLVNLTISGDATIPSSSSAPDVVGLVAANATTVTGAFRNEGMTLAVTGTMNFTGSYFDKYDRDSAGTATDAASVDSVLRVSESGAVNFDITSEVGGRKQAEIWSAVSSDGSISIAANKALYFYNVTEGSGAVSAANATVYYDYADADGQYIFSASGATAYGELVLNGGNKLISGNNVVLAQALVNNSGVTITQTSSLAVNRNVSGNGNFVVGEESQLTFNNTSGSNYAFGDASTTITVEENAYGVVFNGSSATAQVVFNGSLVNNSSSVDADTHFGVTAQFAQFATVENNGTFQVLNSAVKLGEFSLNDGGELIFNMAPVDGGTNAVFTIDGTNSTLIGNGGQVVLNQGELVVADLVVNSTDGDNGSYFIVNAGTTLTINADGQMLPYVEVAEQAALVILSNATIGSTDTTAAPGLKLDGTFTVNGEGKSVTVYGYSTSNPTPEETTAEIFVEIGSELIFFEDAQLYGKVYATIEVAGGALFDTEGWRLSEADISIWFVIDATTSADQTLSSYYLATYAGQDPSTFCFLVKDGSTFTIDEGQADNVFTIKAIRVKDTSSVLLTDAGLTVLGEATADAGTTIQVAGGTTLTFGDPASGVTGYFQGLGVISGSGDVVFNNAVTVTDGTDTGSIDMADGTVTYGASAGDTLFAGNYNNLIVHNNATVGDVVFSGTIAGSGALTFSGTTAAKSGATVTVNGIDVDGTTEYLDVTYGENALTVFAGDYGNLTLDVNGSRTINDGNTSEIDITVHGAINIRGGNETSPVKLTLNRVNLTVDGEVQNASSATIEALRSGTVTFNYNGTGVQDIYSGVYRTLDIAGTGTQRIGNLSLATALISSDGQGTLEINGLVNTPGTVNAVDGDKFINVSYGSGVTAGYFAGEYGNLSIQSRNVNTIDSGAITVNGTVSLSGTILGAVDLAFLGGVSGTAQFGTATDRYTGKVTYGQSGSGIAQTVLGGYYTNVELNGRNKAFKADFSATSLQTDASLAISSGVTVSADTISTLLPGSTTITVNDGATLEIGLTSGQSLSKIVNLGTLRVGGEFTFTSNELSNTGDLVLNADSNIVLDGITAADDSQYTVMTGATLTFQNVGSEDAAFQIGTINSEGNVNFQNSVVNINGALENTGNVTIGTLDGDDATVTLNSDGTVDGWVILRNGSTLNVESNLRINHLDTLGVLNVGTGDNSDAQLTLWEVNSGSPSSDSSTMTVWGNSTLVFDPFYDKGEAQIIYGHVNYGMNPDSVQYNDEWTIFYNGLEGYWIIVSNEQTITSIQSGRGYQIIDGGKLILADGITVAGDLTNQFWIQAGGELEFATGDSAVTVGASVNNEGGVITVGRDVTFNGPLSGTGTLNAADGTTVGYQFAADGTIYSGSYYNLTLSGNGSTATVGDVTVNGLLTGDMNVVFSGATSGAGRVELGTGLTATYQAAAENIFVGQYGDLVLEGTGKMFQAGDTVVNGNFGLATDGMVLNGSGNVTLAGTTSGNGSFNMTGGVVTYGVNAAVYGGTYADLTINGDHVLANDFTVNGLATLTGFQSGTANVTFAGTTGGVGAFNMTGGVVTYEASADIFGGTYAGLLINGDHVVSNSFAVNGLATLNGVLSGSADLNFAGDVAGTGSFNMSGGRVAYSGTGNVLGGVYADLLLVGDRVLANDFTVNGLASVSGTLSGTANVVFAGTTEGGSTGMNMTGGSVRYGVNANVFGGTYNDLILDGGHVLDNTVVVNGTFTVNQTGSADEVISGAGELTINGAVVGAEYTVFDHTGTVTYGAGASTVLAGTYGNLALVGGGGRTLTGDFTVNKTFSLADATRLELTEGSTLTVNEISDTENASYQNYGTINFGAATLNGTVNNYGILSGTSATFNNSVVNAQNGSITVSSATFNGSVNNAGVIGTTGSSLVFNGNTSGIGTVGDGTSATYNSGEGITQTIYGGTYRDLTLDGSKTINTNVVVDGAFRVSGEEVTITISSAGRLELNGYSDGEATFAATGDVVYNGYGTFFSGSYQDLVVNGTYSVGDLTLNGTLSGDGSLSINGATDGNGRVAMDKSGLISYGADQTGVIFGGTYGYLTLVGSKEINNTVTVENTFALQNSGDAASELTGSGNLTFNGYVVYGKGATINNTGSVSYNYEYGMNILAGTYQNLTITGGSTKYVGDVTINGTLSGDGTIYFQGTTEGGEDTLVVSTEENKINAIYGQNADTILKGTYGDMTVYGSKAFDSDVTVDNFTAYRNSDNTTAEISGGAKLTINGVVSNFSSTNNRIAIFAHTGTVVFNGSGTINGGSFADVVVGNRGDQSMAQMTFTNTSMTNLTVGESSRDAFSIISIGKSSITGKIEGYGMILFSEGMTGQDSAVVDMAESSTIYYMANTGGSSDEIFGGTYGNLILDAGVNDNFTRTISREVHVHGTLTISEGVRIVNIASGGWLSVVGFEDWELDGVTASYNVQNGGKLEFGQYWVDNGRYTAGLVVPDTIHGVITVKDGGTFNILESGLTFNSIINEGYLSVSERHVFSETQEDWENRIHFVKFENRSTGEAFIGGVTQIHELENGWTNRGYLSIRNFDNFGFAANGEELTTRLTLVNETNATLEVGNDSVLGEMTTYVFDDTLAAGITLVNSGTISAGNNGIVVFKSFSERVGETASYRTVSSSDFHLGGAMYFELYTPIASGIKGSLVNNGLMNLNTAGQQYLGSVSVTNADAILNINETSTFKGAFSLTNGTVNLGTEAGEGVSGSGYDTITLSGVTHSYSRYFDATHSNVYANAAGTKFVGTVSANDTFTINAANTMFENNVTIRHDFTINAQTEFKRDVNIEANADNVRNTVLTIQSDDAMTLFSGNVTVNGAAGTWAAVLSIDSATEFKGTLTNNGAGAEAVVNVNADNNIFATVVNTGSGASFNLSSTGNTLEGQVSNNTGANFFLNDVNTFLNFNNAGGYLWINENATNDAGRSRFISLSNSGTVTFRGEADIDGLYQTSGETNLQHTGVNFKGGVDNSGTFNVTAAGTFSSDLMNSGTFNLAAASVFTGSISNTGTFNVTAEGNTFSAVNNTGNFLFAAGNHLFTGSFTNAGNMTVSATNDFRGLELVNEGVVTVNAAGTSFGNVLNNEAGTILLAAADIEVFNLTNNGQVTVTGTNVSFGTLMNIGTLSVNAAGAMIDNLMNEGSIVVGDEGRLSLKLVADTESSSMTAIGNGQLIFISQTQLGGPQYINGVVTVDFEENLIYDPQWTIFRNVVYKDWIIISSDVTISDITVSGKYYVIAGGTLTVEGTSASSQFRVADGGKLIFAYDGNIFGGVTVGNGGSMTVNSATQFYGVVTNKGTASIAASGVFFQALNNTGVLNLSQTVSGAVTNSGVLNAQGKGMTLGSGITNSGTVNVTAENVTLGLNNAGTVSVKAAGAVVKGMVNSGTLAVANGGAATIQSWTEGANSNLSVAKGGTLTLAAAIDTVDSSLTNAGTVAANGAVTFNGKVVGNGGTFRGTSMTFDGQTSGTGTFQVDNVTYSADVAQTVFGGTFKNMTLSGEGVKSFISDTTVSGKLTNNASAQVSDGKLTLNTLAGNGGVTVQKGAEVEFKAATTMNGVLDNAGTVTVGANVKFSQDIVNRSSGALDLNANGTAVSVQNDGAVNVNAKNVSVSGTNNGRLNIASNGSATVNMSDSSSARYQNAGVMNLAGRDSVNGRITNSGTLNVTGRVGDFAGGVVNDGTMVIMSGAVWSDLSGVDNNNLLILQGAVDLNGITNDAVIDIRTSGVLVDGFTNAGTVNVQTTMTLGEGMVNNGLVQADGRGSVVTIDGMTEGSGSRLGASNYGELILTGGTIQSVIDNAVNGTVSITGDAVFNKAVVNNGMITASGAMTFQGSTSGSGTVENSSQVTYRGNVDQTIFGGRYNELTVAGTATNTLTSEATVAGTMNLVENLNVPGSLTLSGETAGNGRITSTGEVTYNREGDQKIYLGTYHDLTLGGSGVKNVNGDIVITGDAVRTGDATFTATNGTVNYSSDHGSQQVVDGNYDNLTLSGSGNRYFQTGVTRVDGTFTSTGSTGVMYLDSAVAGSKWQLDVDPTSLNFYNSTVSNSISLRGTIALNGFNTLGTGNSGWMVFDSAGGIGDSFPSEFNLNFSSLALLLGDELRALDLETLLDEGLTLRRLRKIEVTDNGATEISDALETVYDELQLEEAVVDADTSAEVSEADYSDVMDVADAFVDEVDEAISDMVAI